jgi:hypothetical protein
MISVELALWLAAAPCESVKYSSQRETVAIMCEMKEPYGPFIPDWLKTVLAENAKAKAKAEQPKPVVKKAKAKSKKKRRGRRRR